VNTDAGPGLCRRGRGRVAPVSRRPARAQPAGGVKADCPAEGLPRNNVAAADAKRRRADRGRAGLLAGPGGYRGGAPRGRVGPPVIPAAVGRRAGPRHRHGLCCAASLAPARSRPIQAVTGGGRRPPLARRWPGRLSSAMYAQLVELVDSGLRRITSLVRQYASLPPAARAHRWSLSSPDSVDSHRTVRDKRKLHGQGDVDHVRKLQLAPATPNPHPRRTAAHAQPPTTAGP
jgi:hypothetical protein